MAATLYIVAFIIQPGSEKGMVGPGPFWRVPLGHNKSAQYVDPEENDCGIVERKSSEHFFQ